LAATLAADPQLANQVVSALGDWEHLSRLVELQEYSLAKTDTDQEAPILAALDTCREYLPRETLASLYGHCLLRAREKRLSVQERYVALKVACRAIAGLQKPKIDSPDDAKAAEGDRLPVQVAPGDLEAFLLELATDRVEDTQLRRLAVRNLGTLRCLSSAQALASIARKDSYDSPVALRKSALLTLQSLDQGTAMAISADMLATTLDEEIFSAAALVVGRSATVPGLELLIKHAPRCPPDSLAIRTAVRYYRDWVEQQLKDPGSRRLLVALRALQYIQYSADDMFRSDLIALLYRCDLEHDPEVTRELLQRLVGARLSASDCAEVLAVLSSRAFDVNTCCPEEGEYLERISLSVQAAQIGVTR